MDLNHLTKSQILKPISKSSSDTSHIFNFRFELGTFSPLIFHNIKNNVIHVELVSDHSQLQQYS